MWVMPRPLPSSQQRLVFGKNIFTYDQFEISISNDGSNGLPSSTAIISQYMYIHAAFKRIYYYMTLALHKHRQTGTHSTHKYAVRVVQKEQSFQKPQQQTNNLIQLICQANPANRLWNQQIIYRYNKSRRKRKKMQITDKRLTLNF